MLAVFCPNVFLVRCPCGSIISEEDFSCHILGVTAQLSEAITLMCQASLLPHVGNWYLESVTQVAMKNTALLMTVATAMMTRSVFKIILMRGIFK